MSKKYECNRCGKRFVDGHATMQHVNDKHGGRGHPKKIQRQEPEWDDESMASRAVQAEIDIACGLGSDDDWLLP